MNVIEIIGAVIGIIYLILEYKANAWLWLFGVLMPLFYIYLFFHNALYANAVINIYYVGASIYGYLNWRKMKGEGTKASEASVISSMPKRAWWPIIGLLVICTAVLTWILHWLGESNVALLDGFTAALNVVGMYMLAKGWYQQWLCWIVVEPIMVVMSLITGMYPTAVMYLVYCVIAVLGYLRWRREAISGSPK